MAKPASVATPVVAAKNPMNGQADYQAEDDARVLVNAHKIKSDKGRHAKAKAHIHKQIAAMKGVVSKNDNDGDEPAGAY